MLLGLLLVMAGTGGFLILAHVVARPRPRTSTTGASAICAAEDPAIPIGPSWLTPAAQDVTALGGVTVLFVVTAGVVGFFVASRRFTVSGAVLAAVVGGLFVSLWLKAYFGRERQHLVPPLGMRKPAVFPVDIR